jgi:hypothetical protein
VACDAGREDPINNILGGQRLSSPRGRSLDLNRPPLICYLTSAKDSTCMGRIYRLQIWSSSELQAKS